jgi:hypothetical protein
MMPLSTAELDRAVEIRKADAREKAATAAARGGSASSANSGTNGGVMAMAGNKRGACPDEWFVESLCESSYLLLSHGTSGTSNALSTDNEYQRTGRWTDDEIAYVDFLLEAFDHGKLPIEHGMKLNDFLAEMFLCKSSRLTKKLKNARLSIRSYELFNRYNAANRPLDTDLMSTLEEKFLQSISSRASTLELRFNMTRLWRSRLSNLCLQVGSELLDAQDWIASLELMEKRAGQAEETIRKARRRRMGLALRTDTRTDHAGVFFAGLPVQRPVKRAALTCSASDKPTPMGMVLSTSTAGASSSVPSTVVIKQRKRADTGGDSSVVGASSSINHSEAGGSDDGSSDFINDMLDRAKFSVIKPAGMMGGGIGAGTTQQGSDDYNVILNDLILGCSADGTSTPTPFANTKLRNNGGAFLDEIVHYMETEDLPFQHVDVWVPSFSGENKDIIRLYHSGHATRNDVDPALFCQLAEYGEYSSQFSFANKVGLPGRVFDTKAPSWESGLHEADARIFERVGGAKVYGIKTGFGFPLSTRVIGKIVVCMYSVYDLKKDEAVVNNCMVDLGRLCPEPKWKLVVDMGPSNNEDDDASTGCSSEASSTCGSATFPAAASFQEAASKPPDIATIHHGQPSQQSIVSSYSQNPPTAVAPSQEQMEHTIATLLGDHMPLVEVTPGGEPTCSSAHASSSMIVPHFMSLRLILLRSPTRRTTEENEILEVIKKSFQGYSKDGRRSERELAYLLVKDWQYLRSTIMPEQPALALQVQQNHNHRPTMPANTEYQSHVMEPTTRRTSSSASTIASTINAMGGIGGPVSMPGALGPLAFLDHGRINKNNPMLQQISYKPPQAHYSSTTDGDTGGTP